MNINDHLSHDLKTERGNLSDGLPAYYRLVPILFYVTVVTAISSVAYFSMQIRNFTEERTIEQGRLTEITIVTKGIASEKDEVEQERVRAEAVARWIETAQGLQPLVAGLSRSIGEDASIDMMSLKRNPEMPPQIFLTLKLNGEVQEQIGSSMQAVRDLNYRSFSAKQSQGEGILDYNATLLWSGKK